MNEERLFKKLSALVELVSTLRGPGGCPWDARQTDSSIRMYLLEEAYEVLDAVEKGSPDDICKELGDLLFQVIFLARLAEERNEFDMTDVIEKITEKMIKRHPHVFGSEKVSSPEDVAKNWHKIKESENGGAKSFGAGLKSVPVDLPALLRTHRLCERASRAGIDPRGNETVWDEVENNIDDLKRSTSLGDETSELNTIGKLLFSLADLAREKGGNAENLLRMENQKYLESL